MKISSLKDKKILILGLGKEGLSSYKFLKNTFPNKVFGIADQLSFKKLNNNTKKFILENKGKIKTYFGKDYLESLEKYDIIIKTSGMSLKSLPIVGLKKKGKEITSQTRLFFENCPGTIIGITGTKGKSTTSSLIYKILKKGNKKVYLVGNIGKSSLAFLKNATKETVFVYELSSYQLDDLHKSPHIAVILNITPEHLDYHKDFNQYIKAKQNIALHQNKNDYIIFNKDFSIPKKIASGSKAKKILFTANFSKEKNLTCFIKNNFIIYSSSKEEKIIKIDDISLEGNFSLQNITPAIIIGKLFNISNKNINYVIKNFKSLKYRLENIGKYKGITFYNDSLATVPEASIAAIETLGKKVQTIILGGFDRNLNFNKLAKKVLSNKIKNIILFLPTGNKIWDEISSLSLQKNTLPNHFFVNNMEEAIQITYKHTEKENICLLSPASPSFGLFKDYKHRGDLFIHYVKKLSKQKLPKH